MFVNTGVNETSIIFLLVIIGAHLARFEVRIIQIPSLFGSVLYIHHDQLDKPINAYKKINVISRLATTKTETGRAQNHVRDWCLTEPRKRGHHTPNRLDQIFTRKLPLKPNFYIITFHNNVMQFFVLDFGRNIEICPSHGLGTPISARQMSRALTSTPRHRSYRIVQTKVLNIAQAVPVLLKRMLNFGFKGLNVVGTCRSMLASSSGSMWTVISDIGKLIPNARCHPTANLTPLGHRHSRIHLKMKVN